MMKEILFRGKRRDSGEYVEGLYYKIKDESEAYIIVGGVGIDRDTDADYPYTTSDYHVTGIIEVASESVGQFTGAIDMHGTKIFTGMSVRILYSDWPSNSDPNISLEDYKKSISSYGTVVFDDDFYQFGFRNNKEDKYGEFAIGSLNPGLHGEIEIIADL